MVITDTDLISGIKYTGKNLDLNTQRGEVGEAGSVGPGRTSQRAEVRLRNGSWPRVLLVSRMPKFGVSLALGLCHWRHRS